MKILKAKIIDYSVLFQFTDEMGNLHLPTEETTKHILNIISREFAQLEAVMNEQANELIADDPKSFSTLPLMPHSRGNINLQ